MTTFHWTIIIIKYRQILLLILLKKKRIDFNPGQLLIKREYFYLTQIFLLCPRNQLTKYHIYILREIFDFGFSYSGSESNKN